MFVMISGIVMIKDEDILNLSAVGTLDDLATFHLTRAAQGYTCNVCQKWLRDKTDGKRHLESKHFPTNGGYMCPNCSRQFNTQNSMRMHTREMTCQIAPARIVRGGGGANVTPSSIIIDGKPESDHYANITITSMSSD